ncbi:hypothetical protein JCM19231_3059 [Vibrio ishigakensis]|uniref:DNA-3-methyladenine glycosylase n=1 Tax=Vibrio ishigakensis TaxID=1481914 RepID=A0A0B8P499_9VIBR|nr:hypothetical protein JCM19231_3059 [Vibrio ishigakensis]
MSEIPNDGACGWAQNTQIERDYHDSEWGVPSMMIGTCLSA